MRNKDGKITIKSFWKLLRSDKGKKYSFVIFYFFFFIFVYIIINLPGSTLDKEDTSTNKFPFKLTEIEFNNYNFNYLQEENDLKKIYLGSKEDQEITLTIDDKTYNYIYKNGSLKPSSSNEEDIYYQFLDVYEIKRIIKKSKYISKTEYNDSSIVYNYEITNGELADILNKEIFDNLELSNYITIKVKDKKIVDMTFDILSLVNNTKDLDLTYDKFKIDIVYGDIDE